MAESIAIFASINFAIIGASHICQVHGWREFFRKLHALGHAGALANGMLSLLIGSLIISFHNIWTGVPVVLTLVGWALILKAIVVLLIPGLGMRSIESVESAPALKFRIAGLGLIAIAATMALCVGFNQYS